MNILIIGCDKLGSQLANTLNSDGHDVSVVDNNQENFNLLDDDFDGMTLRGNPIDIDVLKTAGIEECDCAIAVTGEDNVNIMSSQIAESIFGVKNVVARVSDTSHEHFFDEIGVNTICPTNLATNAAIAYIFSGTNAEQIVHFGKDSVEFVTFPYNKSMKDKNLEQLDQYSELLLFGIKDHTDHLILYTPETRSRKITAADKLIYSKIIY